MNKVIPREPPIDIGGLRRDYTPTPYFTKTYILGVLHDATERKTTFRIATKSNDFAKVKEKTAIFGLRNFLNLF